VQKGEYATRDGHKARVTTIYMDEKLPYGGYVEGEWGHRWSLIGVHQQDPGLDLCFQWTQRHEEIRMSQWQRFKATVKAFFRRLKR